MRKLATLLVAAIALPALAAKPISIKGSDTMVIMNARLAEAFMAKHPGSVIQVTGGGSGVGIAALINGTKGEQFQVAVRLVASKTAELVRDAPPYQEWPIVDPDPTPSPEPDVPKPSLADA